MRKTIWTTLAVILVFLVWYLVADRKTPFTGNARVKAVATQIVPQVTGTVTEVLVENGGFLDSIVNFRRLTTRYRVHDVGEVPNVGFVDVRFVFLITGVPEFFLFQPRP